MPREPRKFEVDTLEERIAPSSLSLGSIGDQIGNLTDGGSSLGNGSFGMGSDAHAGSDNSSSLSTGHIGSENSFANGSSVNASGAAAGNTVSPTVDPSVNVSPNVNLS